MSFYSTPLYSLSIQTSYNICPAPPRFTLRRFSPPRKGGGVGMRQDFNPAQRGGTKMGLEFLDLPHLTLLRVIIVNFLYLKTLLFKQTYQY